MRRYITEGVGVPRWSSPISHAVVVDETCYVSGQLALDESGSYIPGTTLEEAERAFRNVFAVLRAAGFQPDDLVFVDIAFAALADVGPVNDLYARLFPAERRPARTIYQAEALPLGARIKVMGVAIKERANP